MYEVIFYLDKRERCPTEEFLDQLELKIKAKVIITHGFSKKNDRIPVGEIEKAERSMRDFLQKHERGEIEL